jgi:hypothetical protein
MPAKASPACGMLPPLRMDENLLKGNNNIGRRAAVFVPPDMPEKSQRLLKPEGVCGQQQAIYRPALRRTSTK